MNKKIEPQNYGLEAKKEAFLPGAYEGAFSQLVGKNIKMLELGVQKGASLRFWCDYFENATIVGIDKNYIQIDDFTGRIHVYQGYQHDIQLLDKIAALHAPEGFNVIIDDCAHIGKVARISFWHLFQNHLTPGGIYAIEDWGTGYMPWWPDGKRFRPKTSISYTIRDSSREIITNRIPRKFPKLRKFLDGILLDKKISSHQYGMVGFIKEIVDACCLKEIAVPASGIGRYRDNGIGHIHIFPHVVIVYKSM